MGNDRPPAPRVGGSGGWGRAIATRRGSCSWTVDHAGWVMTLHTAKEQDFSGKTLEKAPLWWLVWLMFPVLGMRLFVV